MKEECEVPPHVAGDQEMLADMLVSVFAEPLRDRGIRQQEADLVRRPLDRMSQHAGVLVNDL